MGKSCAMILLLTGAALAQSAGGNYTGSIKGKLFRDLSTQSHGVYEVRPNQPFSVRFHTKDGVLNAVPAVCAIPLLEVTAWNVDPGIFVKHPLNASGDRGITVSTMPVCAR
jgi:hypothetical protein